MTKGGRRPSRKAIKEGRRKRRQAHKALRKRQYAPNTVKSYVYCVRNLVKHFMRRPDELTIDDINDFQLHLTKERKVAWSTFNIYVFAMRLFFLVTLKKDWEITAIPYQKTGRKLPVVLNGFGGGPTVIHSWRCG